MSSSTMGLSQAVRDYIHTVTVQESTALQSLREETAKLDMAVMQISPEQGQFLTVLAHIVQARKILEVGVFTGYSSICLAKALPDDGQLIACDVSEEWTQMARKYWAQENLSHLIDLRLAPATETLQQLLNNHHAGSFDLAFIDADKPNYINYYEQCLKLLRTGGVILVDNTLWGGHVANPEDDSESTVTLRELNAIIAKDHRVRSSLLTIGDGLTVAHKL